MKRQLSISSVMSSEMKYECTEVARGNTSPSHDDEDVRSLPTSRHKNWMWTAFDTQVPKFNWDHVQYEVHQLEEAPSTGLPHFQGYVQFKNAKALSALKKMHKTAHWEERQGTHEQAKQYCMKEDTRIEGPFEFGQERNEQGRRNDLDALYTSLQGGMSERDVSHQHFRSFIKFHRGIDRWRQVQYSQRTTPPIVTLIYGPSGSGKTRFVYAKHGYEVTYSVTDSKWWNGYAQQEAVLFDEVDFYERTPREWLQILDRYPYQVPNKGGFVPFNSRYIYIISPKIYGVSHFMMGDFRRRFDRLIEFSRGGDYVEYSPAEAIRIISSREAPPLDPAGERIDSPCEAPILCREKLEEALRMSDV